MKGHYEHCLPCGMKNSHGFFVTLFMNYWVLMKSCIITWFILCNKWDKTLVETTNPVIINFYFVYKEILITIQLLSYIRKTESLKYHSIWSIFNFFHTDTVYKMPYLLISQCKKLKETKLLAW